MSTLERRPSYASVVAGTHVAPTPPATAPQGSETQPALPLNTGEPLFLDGAPSDASTDNECGRHLDVDDPAYRGKSTRNRVNGTPTVYHSIIQTRSAKVAGAPPGPSVSLPPRKRTRKRTTKFASTGSDNGYSSGENVAGQPGAKKAKVSHAASLNPVVPTKMDAPVGEDHVPSSSSHKRPRSVKANNLRVDSDSSESEAPASKRRKPTSLSERAREKQREITPPPPNQLSMSRRQTNAKKAVSRRRRSPTPILDDEASVADDDASQPDLNEYDLDDDFIDDSEVLSATETVVGPKDMAVAPSEPQRRRGWPSISGSSPVAPAAVAPLTPPVTPRGPGATFAANVSRLDRQSGSSSTSFVRGSSLQSAFTTPSTPSAATGPPLMPPPNTTPSRTQPPARLRRPFGSVVAASPTTSNASTLTPLTTLDDSRYLRVTRLPAECGVTHSSLQDPILAPYYVGLPPLKLTKFIPWTDNPGMGMIQFSKWAVHCPSMSFDTCLSAIEFRSFQNFMNPARVSPLDYCIREYPGPRPRYHLHTLSHEPAICVSTILSKESKLLEPST